jgi:quercetin dioxygenase-like cupin family protein
MNKISLTALAHEELEHAQSASNGRSTKSVHGGTDHLLRQSVIALCAGHSVAEHDNPGEVTVQVLLGRVLLTSGETSWTGWIGDLLVVPTAPHSLEAIEDAVVLLTAVRRP